MEQIDLNKLIDLIKVYFPQDGFEISDALDLLNLALEGLLNSANNVMTELNKSKDYDKSMELQLQINFYSAGKIKIFKFVA